MHGAVLAGVAAATLAIPATADPAFELTPSAAFAHPGETIDVRGRAGPGPVEIRWDSASGLLVGTGSASGIHGPPFSVPVTVPSGAQAGLHQLVLVAGGRAVARAPLEVAGPAHPPARASPSPAGAAEPSGAGLFVWIAAAAGAAAAIVAVVRLRR